MKNEIIEDQFGLMWFEDDKLHREDGPAVDNNNGTKFWYYKGEYVECSSQEEFEIFLKFKAFW